MTRAIAEYRIRDRPSWLVALSADGETYDQLAAHLMSHITDCVEVRPRGDHRAVTDNGLRACAACGGAFGARRRDAKYCGPTCRQRASRIRRADLAPPTLASGAGNASDSVSRIDVHDGEVLEDAAGDASSLNAAALRPCDVFGSLDAIHVEPPAPRTAVRASASTLAARSGASSSKGPAP